MQNPFPLKTGDAWNPELQYMRRYSEGQEDWLKKKSQMATDLRKHQQNTPGLLTQGKNQDSFIWNEDKGCVLAAMSPLSLIYCERDVGKGTVGRGIIQTCHICRKHSVSEARWKRWILKCEQTCNHQFLLDVEAEGTHPHNLCVMRIPVGLEHGWAGLSSAQTFCKLHMLENFSFIDE